MKLIFRFWFCNIFNRWFSKRSRAPSSSFYWRRTALLLIAFFALLFRCFTTADARLFRCFITADARLCTVVSMFYHCFIKVFALTIKIALKVATKHRNNIDKNWWLFGAGCVKYMYHGKPCPWLYFSLIRTPSGMLNVPALRGLLTTVIWSNKRI